jgi:hypothetical protein
MKNVQTPQLLTDLYRDLRDRRLLVPALVLVVALIAVPVALSSSSATTAPPAPAPAATAGGSEGETATSPAVLTEELGVTDYRKRLEQLQGNNPFQQQFALPEVTSKVEESSATAPVTTGATTSGGGSTSTSVTAEPTSTSSTQPDPGTPPSSSKPSGNDPEPTLYVFEADLAIGLPGDLSRRKHVGLGKFQPSNSKPMIAFIGATEGMKHGLFVVSDEVSLIDTDGRCVPGPNNCRLLRLKIGDEAKLAYAPEDGRTYKLRLLGIDLAPFDASASNKRGKRGKQSSLFALAAQG